MSEQGAGATPFSPTDGRALVAALRDAGHGSVVVTSGLRDLRLVLGAGEVGLESAGGPLEGGDERDLIRAFLCALFWEDPLGVGDPDATRRDDVPAIRVRGDAEAILGQIEQGLTELGELRAKVPSLEVLLAVSGDPPPPEVDAPAARLFRAAVTAPAGMLLSLAAEEAGLDAIDAAWAVVDLMEAKQAAVRRLSPTVAMRRLKHTEGLVDEGLHVGLRLEYVARGLARAEPRRSASFLRQAGDMYRAAGRAEAAVACYRGCLQLAPEDLGAREGLVVALAGLGRGAEAKATRLELVQRYAGARLPLRARAHLVELGELTLEQQHLLLDCLLAGGEHAEAAEQAERLAPKLSPDERALLPARFAAAGVGGQALDRATRASGVSRLRPLRRLLLAMVMLGLLGVSGLGLEAYARVRFAAAAEDARADLGAWRFQEARGRFAELAHLSSNLMAGRWPLASSLGEVSRVTAHLDDLEADQAVLDEHLSLLLWRGGPDTVAADLALQELGRRARTQELRDLLAAERAEIAAYRQQAMDDLKLLQDLVIAGRSKDALAHAQQLVDAYHNVRDLFAERTVPVRVVAEPKGAVLSVDGRHLEPLARDSGEWEIRVRLDGRPVELTAVYPSHVPQVRVVRFPTLREPEVRFELISIHQDSSLAWPEAGGAPGVHFQEDARTVSQLRAVARGPLTLEESATRAALAAALPGLGERQRLVVVAVSDQARRRVLLRELAVFLEEGGRRATPWRLNVGRLDRSFTDDPAGSTLHDLARQERFGLIVEAITEVVARMQGELAR